MASERPFPTRLDMTTILPPFDRVYEPNVCLMHDINQTVVLHASQSDNKETELSSRGRLNLGSPTREL